MMEGLLTITVTVTVFALHPQRDQLPPPTCRRATSAEDQFLRRFGGHACLRRSLGTGAAVEDAAEEAAESGEDHCCGGGGGGCVGRCKECRCRRGLDGNGMDVG